uniref:LOW QUALITY PROTEIN: uncharacterized protein LOC108052634 n=1 Tax=Drosophila rhopaloa TaxID=1041015 RepID=A0A6P4FJ77_DRORH
MQDYVCQQVIARNVPQLVRLLLDSPIEGNKDGESERMVNADTFESCLRYARNHLQYTRGHLESCPEAVLLNMNYFLERYRTEKLPEFADTFKQLANVILNHPLCLTHMQENLHWSLIDFMLSVNYRAFQTVQRNWKEMEQKRKNILEALTLASESSDEFPEEKIWRSVSRSSLMSATSRLTGGSSQYDLSTDQLASHRKWARNQTQSARSLFNSDHTSRNWDAESELSVRSLPQMELIEQQKSPVPTQISGISYSTYIEPKLNNVQVKENFAIKEASMDLELNLTQVESTKVKPTKVNFFKGANDLFSRIQTPWWKVDIHVYHEPRILGTNFSQDYGIWLLYQLRESRHSVRKMSEEQELLRELIILFFATVDFNLFEILDEGFELRKDGIHTCALSQLTEGPFFAEILNSLKEIRNLRQLIELHTTKRISGDRLETLTSFSVALRRLLRPVMEFLVYFERRLTKGLETPTLQHFVETSSAPFERIMLLYHFSKDNYDGDSSVRSMRFLESLFMASSKSSQPKLERYLSASLLLHSLQAYCQFLDSWWLTGEFTDWHEEFPYQRLIVAGRTEYDLRKLFLDEVELQKGTLFKIIQRHIIESRQAVAILYDSRKIGDFNSLHGNVMQISLHNSLMEMVLKELAPYQTESIEDNSYAPDILEQLKLTDQEPVRRLFYNFHMETRPDPWQPSDCSLDEFLMNFQACASYTPISEIISQELRRLLHRRSLLANSYISEMVNKSQVDKTVRHLQSAFLLLNYDLLRSEFELFFELMERNRLIIASNQLKEILASQDPRLSVLLRICLTGPHPEFICIKVSYDPILNRVINQLQIDQMNKYFRLKLNVHFSLYQLKDLPAFEINKSKRLVQALRSLKTSLVSALEEQLSHPDKLNQLEELTTLSELRQNHKLFMLQIKEKLRVEFKGGRYPCSLEDILNLSRVLRYRWLRARSLINDYRRQKPSNICDVKYEWLRFYYLQSTFKHCKAIDCFLGQI